MAIDIESRTPLGLFFCIFGLKIKKNNEKEENHKTIIITKQESLV